MKKRDHQSFVVTMDASQDIKDVRRISQVERAQESFSTFGVKDLATALKIASKRYFGGTPKKEDKAKRTNCRGSQAANFSGSPARREYEDGLLQKKKAQKKMNPPSPSPSQMFVLQKRMLDLREELAQKIGIS